MWNTRGARQHYCDESFFFESAHLCPARHKARGGYRNCKGRHRMYSYVAIKGFIQDPDYQPCWSGQWLEEGRNCDESSRRQRPVTSQLRNNDESANLTRDAPLAIANLPTDGSPGSDDGCRRQDCECSVRYRSGYGPIRGLWRSATVTAAGRA